MQIKHLRRSQFRPKKRSAPVTIIVGIICKTGIVVASDSQTTYGTSKSTKAEKIRQINFKGSKFGILATAGDVVFSQRVAEIAQEVASTRTLSDYRSLAEVTEKAVARMRAAIINPYRSIGSLAEFEDHFRENHESSFLMANYFEGKPLLYTLDFPPGIATKRKEHAAVGCGSILAEFLLNWFPFPSMGHIQTALTAAFIIGEVKKADAYCGGPTRLGWITADGRQLLGFDEEVMVTIEREVEAGSLSYKAHWGETAGQMVSEIVKKLDLG